MRHSPGILSFLSAVGATFAVSETADEYHSRMQPLLEDAFNAQNETSAWWIGFSHPLHGDHHWAFGSASDTDGVFPPDVPAGLDDHFFVGSISKTFGAAVNLRLIEEGRFTLDDALADVAPALVAMFPPLANYTPADLMGMQTRVPDFLNDPDGFLATLVADPDGRFSIPELIEFAMQGFPVLLPEKYAAEMAAQNMTLADFGMEEYYEYSTTNILAMEWLAENVTGRSMAELVAELATEPLGLAETVLPPRDAPKGVLREPVSHSYIGQQCVEELIGSGADVKLHERNDALVDSVVNFSTGGSMYSTIVDLLQWAKSGLGDALLKDDTIQARHVFKITNLILHYGLGLHLFNDELPYSNFDEALENQRLARGWYGHGGDAFGSNARAWKNDDTGAAFASAVTTCGSMGAMHGRAFRILAADYARSSAETTAPTAAPVASSPVTTSAPTSDASPRSVVNVAACVVMSIFLTLL